MNSFIIPKVLRSNGACHKADALHRKGAHASFVALGVMRAENVLAALNAGWICPNFVGGEKGLLSEVLSLIKFLKWHFNSHTQIQRLYIFSQRANRNPVYACFRNRPNRR